MSLEIRISDPEDAVHFKTWLTDPKILRWFPMMNEQEIEDAVRVALNYAKMGACFTAFWNGVPCGMANLYLQGFKKIAHQALFSIIVDEKLRGRGIGTKMMEHLIDVSKRQFALEVLHLEVYEGNPAINLYKRLGFEEFGRQKHFIKDHGQYIARVMMEKRL